MIRYTANKHLVLAGGVATGGAGYNGGYNPGTVVLGRMVMVSELQFPYNSFTSTPASKTAGADRGMIALDDENLYYRTASEWKKAPLQDFDYTTPAPLLERNTTHMNP